MLTMAAMVLFLITPASGPPPAAAAPVAEDPAFRKLALAALGRMWATIRYQHPAATLDPGAWEAALVAALPLAERARDDDGVVAAMADMIRRLGDPLTRVVTLDTPPPVQPPPGPLYSARRGKTLLVDLTRVGPGTDWRVLIPEIRSAMEHANHVIFDLRVTAQFGGFLLPLYLDALTPDLLVRDAILPGERSLLHIGQPPEGEPGTVGQSGFFDRPARRLRARPGTKPRRVAVVLNAHTGVPTLALALQASGTGLVIAQGTDIEEQLTTTTIPISGTRHAVVLRVKQVGAGDARKPAADITLPANAPAERALTIATDWVARDRPLTVTPRPRPRARPLPAIAPAPAPAAASTQVPDRPYRLLALFKLSAVVEAFFPHKALMDRPWDQVVDDLIPRFEDARTPLSYQLAVAQAAAQLGDAHGWLSGGQALDDRLGHAIFPFFARMVEGRPVVTGLRDPQAAAAAGVQVGDVLVAIDDVAVAARMQELAPYLPAPHPVWHQFATLGWVLRGPRDVTARVKVLRRDGKPHTLSVIRRDTWWRRPERDGPIVKLLPGNVGYIDLDRLELDGLPQALESLRASRGLVLDMRGYPRLTGHALAARLNTRKARVGALLRCPVVRAEGAAPGDSLTFETTIPEADGWIYAGKTALLIDERTMSQGEHTGVLLVAAAGTKLVGTASAGANGDTTSVSLPGGLTVAFTGQEVRHADGRGVQRVGLRPDVEVRPTLAGIQAGRDEVLDRALDLLRR
jgi:C-terminal processing protease CtpA/Prc